MFNKLRQLRINHFQITIDGDRQTHDTQRVLANGAPTYDRILNNLNSIRQYDLSGLWNISLRTNVTKKVIDNYDSFYRDIIVPFGQDKRFNIMIRQMWTNNTDSANALLCSREEFETFVERLDVGKQSLYQEYQFAHNLNFQCYAAKANSFVWGSDGNIYKCTLALYDDINRVGCVQDDGSTMIDREKLYYWIAPRAGKTENCQTCRNFAACASGCCPYKQKQICGGSNFDILKLYIPKFFEISNNKAELTNELDLLKTEVL